MKQAVLAKVAESFCGDVIVNVPMVVRRPRTNATAAFINMPCLPKLPY
jgi:hypothetical protein